MRYFGFLSGYKWMIWIGWIGMLCACSNEDEHKTVSFHLVEEVSGIQKFTWGESHAYAVTGENVEKFIVTAKPKGWTVSVEGEEIRVTAPQSVSGVEETVGEIVVKASNGGENSAITIGVEIPASIAIDLSSPALFDDSEVLWAVSADGDTLAEVCREYVRRDNVTVGQGIRAVVVYLYDPATKTFQRGFVATNSGGVDHDGGNYLSGSIGPVQVVYVAEGVCFGTGKYDQVPVARLIPQTVEDVEGNRYGMVKVGTQYWLRENLRTLTYNDGSAIGSHASWYKDQSVDVSSSDKLKKMFGVSYDLTAVRNEKLAPQGWQAASDEDWLTLERFFRMTDNDLYSSSSSSRGEGIGDYLKSEGDEWANKGAGSNLSGLGITPGGATNNAIMVYAYQWAVSPTKYYFRLLNSTYSTILRRQGDGWVFMNVRCVRKD